MKKILFSAFMLLVAVMASAKDIKTVVLTTDPIMHCANCENKIKENLKFCKGIKSIETSVENQTVTIQYDADKTSPDAFVQSLKKANYVATEKKSCSKQQQSSCSGKCKAEQKSCCKEKQQGQCEGGKCKAEQKSCCKEKQQGQCEGGKCQAEQKSCCKEKQQGQCEGGKCKAEQKSCGDCKHHEKKVDATTGATKQNK